MFRSNTHLSFVLHWELGMQSLTRFSFSCFIFYNLIKGQMTLLTLKMMVWRTFVKDCWTAIVKLKKIPVLCERSILKEDLDRWRNFSSNMVQFLGHFFSWYNFYCRRLLAERPVIVICQAKQNTKMQSFFFSEIKFCIELENMFSNVWHTIKCIRQWLRQVCLYYAGWLATISLFLKGEWVSVFFSCIIIVMKVWTIMWDERKVTIIILLATLQNINSKSVLSPPISLFLLF